MTLTGQVKSPNRRGVSPAQLKRRLSNCNYPLATNSAEQPGNVQAREVDAPNLRQGKLQVELPASALWVGEYELR